MKPSLAVALPRSPARRPRVRHTLSRPLQWAGMARTHGVPMVGADLDLHRSTFQWCIFYFGGKFVSELTGKTPGNQKADVFVRKRLQNQRRTHEKELENVE
jgi:hypothetical protein